MTRDVGDSRRAALAARDYLVSQGWDEATVTDCELALVEACNNAIRYSAPRRDAKPLAVEVECRPDQVEMRVSDHSVGFHWPREAALPGPEMESGRGIYIIQTVMDEVKYCEGVEENVLVLRRGRREMEESPK